MDSPSVTPRRSQRVQNLSSPTTTTSTSPSIDNETPMKTAKMTSRRSPFLPTPLEIILLSAYPAILVTGSLFALIDPTARNAPYNPSTQSHFANSAPSYFAKKSNVFNVFFVKKGWAWVTFTYLFFLFTHPSTGPPRTLTSKRLRGMLRYGLVTLWWIFVTQWFFGPAIIDRGFRLTGGQCELVQQANAGQVDMETGRQLFTNVACKAVGGKWRGGHDISGHVFLLVLGSMFLFEEVLHAVWSTAVSKDERTIMMTDGAVKSAEVEASLQSRHTAEAPQWTVSAKITMGVAGLMLYMLLMTAVYFHTWFEKVSLLNLSNLNMLMPREVYRAISSDERHLCRLFPTEDSAHG